MAGRKRKRSRLKILNEIRSQLVLQAERWGRKEYYTPLRLEEMELEQSRFINGDLLAEKSNLEYELHMLGSNKHDLLIKMERLSGYIKKASRVIEGHEKSIKRTLDKLIKDRDKLDAVIKRLRPDTTFSVMINSN